MHKLHFLQKLPIGLSEAWDFFSQPANLEKITPASLGFKITENHEDKCMYAGQVLSYTFTPLWKIRLEWVTEITAVQKPLYFIDEQRFGPYAFWHHEHWFTAISGGVLMEDIIYYKLPLGVLGKALHSLKIKNDLEEIFKHRQTILEKTFGAYPSNPNNG